MNDFKTRHPLAFVITVTLCGVILILSIPLWFHLAACERKKGRPVWVCPLLVRGGQPSSFCRRALHSSTALNFST